MKQGKTDYLTRWKSHSDIERQFSPANWGYALQNPSRAYQADCPTLLDYGRLYGENYPADWIYLHVLALYGSSGNKEKGVADGIPMFSQAFAASVKHFKMSELMLFFARYKAGVYDNSYASFDARRLGNAFHKEFLPQREKELEKIERERNRQEIEERRYTAPEGESSLSVFRKLKELALTGDKDALAQLGEYALSEPCGGMGIKEFSKSKLTTNEEKYGKPI